ncbi:MAG: glycosyltransferase [candidate division Zixibacteria bacterium]|nr:glycosyltransferase [candidate division Zixibacteria bacterium]
MGGGQVYLLRQLSQLDTDRFEPVVVCPTEGPLTDQVRQAGVQVHILPIHPGLIDLRKEDLVGHPFLFMANPFRLAGCVFRLARWINREEIRLIHLNSMKAGFYGGMAGRLAGLPTVWDFKDIVSEDFFPALNRRLIIAIGNTYADVVVANSHAIGRAFVEQGGHREKLTVIHNGIDLDIFHPGLETATLRQSIGIADDAPVVSIFSRLDRWKGHTYFLQAAAQVHRMLPKVRFLVVGATTFDDTEYTEEVMALTRDLGLTECVRYLGFREDTAPLMAASDVIVHASTLPEPLGLTPLEAQAVGRPVVAVGAGGVLETVEDGKTGLLIPPRNAEAMAQALLTLLGSPELRRKMGISGRARAETLFDLRINAHRVQHVYHRLLSRTYETGHRS